MKKEQKFCIFKQNTAYHNQCAKRYFFVNFHKSFIILILHEFFNPQYSNQSLLQVMVLSQQASVRLASLTDEDYCRLPSKLHSMSNNTEASELGWLAPVAQLARNLSIYIWSIPMVYDGSW